MEEPHQACQGETNTTEVDEKKHTITGRKVKRGPIQQQLRWNMRQKKKLLSLLQEYPIDGYKSIASKIPEKDEEQVKEYILKVKEKVKSQYKLKGVKKAVVQRAPLEEWLEISSDMVEFEHVDSSANLAKVMSVITNFEDFSTVRSEKCGGPDFKSIYKYMSQLLQTDREEDLIKLGPLESAIMLDMLHSLMDVLSEHDLTVQCNIMKWKHQLLEGRDKNGHSVPEYMKRASENDFTDFINEMKMERERELNRERRYMERRAKREPGTDKGIGKAQATASTSTHTGTMPTISSEVSTSETSTSSSALREQTEDDDEDLDDSKDKPSFKRHKPGRKGALDPPEIPRTEIYLVMPPKGVEIVNYNSRTKRVIREREDGKYQALDQEEELINEDLGREITYDVHRTEMKMFANMTKEQENKMLLASQKRKQRDEEMQGKYANVMKTNEERIKNVPVKKPKLYSLNPFCLPVTLLDIGVNKKKVA